MLLRAESGCKDGWLPPRPKSANVGTDVDRVDERERREGLMREVPKERIGATTQEPRKRSSERVMLVAAQSVDGLLPRQGLSARQGTQRYQYS